MALCSKWTTTRRRVRGKNLASAQPADPCSRARGRTYQVFLICGKTPHRVPGGAAGSHLLTAWWSPSSPASTRSSETRLWKRVDVTQLELLGRNVRHSPRLGMSLPTLGLCIWVQTFLYGGHEWRIKAK